MQGGVEQPLRCQLGRGEGLLQDGAVLGTHWWGGQAVVELTGCTVRVPVQPDFECIGRSRGALALEAPSCLTKSAT